MLNKKTNFVDNFCGKNVGKRVLIKRNQQCRIKL